MAVYSCNVNGIKVEAVYADEVVNDIFMPLLQHFRALYSQKKRRTLIFLAAPPAAGKSTLALCLEQLYQQQYDDIAMQALGMDGFHYHQDYILTHYIMREGNRIPMKSVKGCPETFDIDHLQSKLQQVLTEDILWPYYNRSLHDVEEDRIRVFGDIILLEGNYLLLQESAWRHLIKLCDYSIFLDADQDLLQHRLIKRKIAGGVPPHQAAAFYEQSEKLNIERIRQHSGKADLLLKLDHEGTLYQPNHSAIKNNSQR